MIKFKATITNEEGRLMQEANYVMPDHYYGMLKGLMGYIEEFEV
ncbi:hypothetical protein LCGC14_2705150 [marine sediment metagenome]|uniref:Uncharacterized protein n=1 Tax=marine sediment metagenome TaxID=412755 RepID=A0A0F8ZEL4_9ZZZZ